jgi:hypothetical protein
MNNPGQGPAQSGIGATYGGERHPIYPPLAGIVNREAALAHPFRLILLVRR